MAAALLVGMFDNEDEHINRNIMAERLLRPHNDVLNFPDHILISFYRLLRHYIYTFRHYIDNTFFLSSTT